MPAAGKLTMARRLAEERGAMIVDNHYIHDFVRPFIGKHNGAEEYWRGTGKINSELRRLIGLFYPKDRPVEYVFTQVLCEGSDLDAKYLRELKKLARDIGGEFVPIVLRTALEVLKKRGATESRAKRGKIHCPEKMERVMAGRKLLEIRHRNLLILDSSEMTEDETFAKILAHVRSI